MKLRAASLILFCIVSSNLYAQSNSNNIYSINNIETVSTYPNPSHGSFQIVTKTIDPDFTIQLYIVNILGQAIYIQSLIADENGNIKQQIILDASVPKGMYFIRIEDDYTNHDIIRLKIE